MAVYTKLTKMQIGELLTRYDLGALQSFRGAEDGIENTTYFLVLENGEQLVLTLFESFSSAELPFYIELTSALNARGLPVPCPMQDTDGSEMQMITDKPVLLYPFVMGKHIEHPNCEEVRKVALFLVNIHQQSLTLPLRNSCPGDIDWMRRSWNYVKPSLSDDENQIVEDMLVLQDKVQGLNIPRAVIHRDLFRDNILFDEGEVSAVIDFYYAGTEALILDIAIAVNDWCLNDEGLVDSEMRGEFLEAYESRRKFTSLEQEHWQAAQQLAATSFWLSRQESLVRAQQGAQQVIKDPAAFKRLLLQHLDFI